MIVNAGFQDLRIYEIGANLIWTPVKQLDIGVEAVYRNLETKGRERQEFGQTLTQVGTGNRPDPRFTSEREQDAWEARLRVQREF